MSIRKRLFFGSDFKKTPGLRLGYFENQAFRQSADDCVQNVLNEELSETISCLPLDIIGACPRYCRGIT